VRACGGYDKSKSAFKEWIRHYVKNNIAAERNVIHVTIHNRPKLKGVKFKDIELLPSKRRF
jgi:hypothetical protein